MEKTRRQILDIIAHSQRILLMPSAPADGDSLGSALALYLVFKKLGKEVTVVSCEPVPDAFQFLPTTNVISSEFSASNDFIVTIDCEKAKVGTIKTKLEQDKVNIIITAKQGQFAADQVSFHHGPNKYDIIITVDTGDVSQLGRFYEDNPELFTQIPVINIDHHASNGHFGRINMVDIMASATTEMLIPLIEELERDTGKKLIDEDIATLLLAGIITDTGSFQNANTTPRSFASAAHLVKYGARQQEIIQHVFKTKRLSTLRLWGRILSNIKIDPPVRLVWATISQKDFQDTDSRYDETGGIIDELMTNAPGTEVVILLKQREENLISGSVRTTNASTDASKIAQMFGGGGHVQAAGFRIESKDLVATEKMVIDKVREFQKQRLGLIEENEAQEVNKPAEQALNPPPSKLQKAIEKTSKPVNAAESTNTSATPAPQPQPQLKSDISSQTHSQSQEDANFTDVIVRKSKDEETELENGFTYKFEE